MLNQKLRLKKQIVNELEEIAGQSEVEAG